MMERCPADTFRLQWRGVYVARELLHLAQNSHNAAHQECAVRGLAVICTADEIMCAMSSSAAALLLLQMLTSPSYSDSAAGNALVVFARIISFSQQRITISSTRAPVSTPGQGPVIRAVLDNGGVCKLLKVLQSGEARPERLELAGATVATLVSCEDFFLKDVAETVELLICILGLADNSPAAAGAALGKLAETLWLDEASDAEFRRLDVPAALVGGILGVGTSAAAAQHARYARAVLCFFAARSVENAMAVFRQRGMPVLIKALLKGPAEADCSAATTGLRLMATVGGPLVRTAIREARQQLDARLASTHKVSQGTSVMSRPAGKMPLPSLGGSQPTCTLPMA